MSSWPWMKGLSQAIADPIPPINEYDNRPSVKGMIEGNRKQIDEVKKDLKTDPLYDENKHDDLWILRFLLSHKKNPRTSLKAAKSTLLFRKERHLDDKDIRFCPLGKSCEDEAVQLYHSCCADDAALFAVPDTKRGVVAFLDLGGMDQHKILKNVDRASLLSGYCYLNEWSFQWVDYVSRTTGRLTKSVRLIDMANVYLSNLSYENLQRDGDIMGIMEDCYPQLLQSLFVCNPPAWIHIPWKICRVIMPKRVVSKMDFIAPAKNKKERAQLLAYLSEDNLPTRHGGKHDSWPVHFPLK
jgi:CRAL/TRIO domain